VCINAGVSIASEAPLWQASITDWQWMLDVNMWSVIHGVRIFVPILLELDEGHIVNTASIAGLIPAVMGIQRDEACSGGNLGGRQLQLAVCQTNVGESVLCPGWVQTRIDNSERNRLGKYLAEGPVDVPARVIAERRGLLAGGTPPSFVAASVLDAIRADQFYVLPHPEWMSLVRSPVEDIERGEAPRSADISTIQHFRAVEAAR
jgi:short-subunit dehydrogenase